MNKLPKRKLQRKKGYDYTLGGSYFITICTHNKEKIFAEINPNHDCSMPNVILTDVGIMVENTLNNMNDFYDEFEIGEYIIMPNHIHFILYKNTNNNISISEIIKRFKTFTSRFYDGKLWQKSYYDHIIRNEKDYEEIAKYIYENPARWVYDDLH